MFWCPTHSLNHKERFSKDNPHPCFQKFGHLPAQRPMPLALKGHKYVPKIVREDLEPFERQEVKRLDREWEKFRRGGYKDI